MEVAALAGKGMPKSYPLYESVDLKDILTAEVQTYLDELYIAMNGIQLSDNFYYADGGVAHSKAAWAIRSNETLVDRFAEAMSCPAEDLLVSFEGLEGRFQKNGARARYSYLDPDIDETVKRGIFCIKNDNLSTYLSFIYPSTSYEYQTRGVYRKVTKASVNLTHEQIVIPAPGSLVIWDSDVPMSIKTLNSSGAFIAQCVSMTHKPLLNTKDVLLRVKMFSDARATSCLPLDQCRKSRKDNQIIEVVTAANGNIASLIGTNKIGGNDFYY